jgi:hypothetical protein
MNSVEKRDEAVTLGNLSYHPEQGQQIHAGS